MKTIKRIGIVIAVFAIFYIGLTAWARYTFNTQTEFKYGPFAVQVPLDYTRGYAGVSHVFEHGDCSAVVQVLEAQNDGPVPDSIAVVKESLREDNPISESEAAIGDLRQYAALIHKPNGKAKGFAGDYAVLYFLVAPRHVLQVGCYFSSPKDIAWVQEFCSRITYNGNTTRLPGGITLQTMSNKSIQATPEGAPD